MDLLKQIAVAEVTKAATKAATQAGIPASITAAATQAATSAAGVTSGQSPVIAPQFESPTFSESPATEAAPPPDENENFDNATNSDLLIKLVQPGYVKKPKLWFSIIWILITDNLIPISVFITYVVMLGFQSTKLIIIGLYIFGGIFWGFFPYYLKCIMLFKITGIATCTHRLVYPLIGLIFWIIALSMHN
jgi:hypothetical protein